MTLVPLNALRAFEAAARLKSFKAAAESLFVTQSAISHQIRHLEDFLRIPLYDRSGARPRILSHGQALARTLSLSLGEIEAACQRVSQTHQQKTIVIAAIPSIAVCWLIPRLSRFRARHPDVASHVVYAMHGHEIDFATTHLGFVFSDRPPQLPGVRALTFLPGDSVPVCSPQLMEGQRSAAEIKQAGLLHDTDRSGWTAWLLRAGDEPDSHDPGPIFEDFNLLRAAALAGQGVALCPLAMIRDDLETGRLTPLSSITVLEEFNYYLLMTELPDGQLARNAEALREWAFTERGSAA